MMILKPYKDRKELSQCDTLFQFHIQSYFFILSLVHVSVYHSCQYALPVPAPVPFNTA